MEAALGATLFYGAVIAGITEMIRLSVPKVNGAFTIAVAVGVGILLALADNSIGVQNISVAQGILLGFGTAGTVGTAKRIG